MKGHLVFLVFGCVRTMEYALTPCCVKGEGVGPIGHFLSLTQDPHLSLCCVHDYTYGEGEGGGREGLREGRGGEREEREEDQRRGGEREKRWGRRGSRGDFVLRQVPMYV